MTDRETPDPLRVEAEELRDVLEWHATGSCSCAVSASCEGVQLVLIEAFARRQRVEHHVLGDLSTALNVLTDYDMLEEADELKRRAKADGGR